MIKEKSLEFLSNSMNYNSRNYKIHSCIECNQRDTSPVSMIGKIISPDKTILKKADGINTVRLLHLSSLN
jgi:hypothetical protein